MVTLTQLVTSSVDIMKTLDSSFSQDPPDFVGALETVDRDGWKIVEIMTPLQSQADAKFVTAENAWREAFDGSGQLAQDLASKNKALVIQAFSDTVSKGLRTSSAAMPENSKYFDAIEKLFVGISQSIIDFGKAVWWIDASSLIQLGGSNLQQDSNTGEILTTGTLIVTSLLEALSANPPDIERAIDTINVYGWKVVKLIVPEEKHNTDEMRNAKKAWGEVFWNAHGLIEESMDASKGGSTKEMINVILRIIETGLNAAAEVATEQKVLLDALVDAINGLGGSIVEFAVTTGYMF
jgi:hypothetical protein